MLCVDYLRIINANCFFVFHILSFITKKYAVPNVTNNQKEVESDEKGGIESGTASDTTSRERTQKQNSNACPICLDEYEAGDLLVYSVETKECPHSYHRSCMGEVIASQAKKGSYIILCPCCRQVFVVTEFHDVEA